MTTDKIAWNMEVIGADGVQVGTVDGVANLQGCMIRVRDGMRVKTQHGNRTLGT